jgi:hypothetical protein
MGEDHHGNLLLAEVPRACGGEEPGPLTPASAPTDISRSMLRDVEVTAVSRTP